MTGRRTCSSCRRDADGSKGVATTTVRGHVVWKCQSCCDVMTDRKAGRYVPPRIDNETRRMDAVRERWPR